MNRIFWISLFFGLLFVIYVIVGLSLDFIHHRNNRKQMLSPTIYVQVANGLISACNSTKAQIIIHNCAIDTRTPVCVRHFNPLHGQYGPEGASFEMHGGLDHYGYQLRLDEELLSRNIKVWDLIYYTETEHNKLLSVTVGTSAPLPQSIMPKE